MVFVDTSVILAGLLGEEPRPPIHFWDKSLYGSRLSAYETWNRLHAKGWALSHGPAATALLTRISMAELTPEVLKRAFDPFPPSVRTLDGLHLATFEYLRRSIPALRLATYDRRMIEAAKELGYSLEPLP